MATTRRTLLTSVALGAAGLATGIGLQALPAVGMLPVPAEAGNGNGGNNHPNRRKHRRTKRQNRRNRN